MASSGPGMITREDEKLLVEVTPRLMGSVNIADSPLLAELKMRRAITRMQEEVIKVWYIATVLHFDNDYPNPPWNSDSTLK